MDAHARIAELEAQLAELEAQLAELEAENAELEAAVDRVREWTGAIRDCDLACFSCAEVAGEIDHVLAAPKPEGGGHE